MPPRRRSWSVPARTATVPPASRYEVTPSALVLSSTGRMASGRATPPRKAPSRSREMERTAASRIPPGPGASFSTTRSFVLRSMSRTAATMTTATRRSVRPSSQREKPLGLTNDTAPGFSLLQLAPPLRHEGDGAAARRRHVRNGRDRGRRAGPDAALRDLHLVGGHRETARGPATAPVPPRGIGGTAARVVRDVALDDVREAVAAVLRVIDEEERLAHSRPAFRNQKKRRGRP